MMKIARVKAPAGLENLFVATTEKPSPKAGEILVKIKANSLNYHDYVVAIGGIPTDDGRVPMSDAAGEVVALGEGATKFAIGDPVMSLFFPTWKSGAPDPAGFRTTPGDGIDGFATEYVAMPETAFTRIPAGYSFEEASTLPCAALTAWRALFVAGDLRPGQWVLTQGTGGVSVFVLQFAKAAGARVISTSSSDDKLEKMKALGADHVINYKTTPNWGKAAKALTGGVGVDEIVEVGGPGTLAQSIKAARFGAHISLIGVLTGLSGDVPTSAFMFSNLRMTGITVGSEADQLAMIAAIEANGIKPVISDTFTLDEIAKAFEHQAAQKHFGKIVLRV